MDKRIWKYAVPIQDTFEAMLPEGAQILKAEAQQGKPQMWVKVDPKKPLVRRIFHIFGTGHPMPESDLHYISTFQTHNGMLVWHLFEELYPSSEVRS